MTHRLQARHSRLQISTLMLFCLLVAGTGFSQDQPVPWIEGPGRVDLGSQAEVDIDATHLFADGPSAKRLMEMMGNPSSGSEIGLIAPSADNKSWFLLFEHFPVGYVEDDDKDAIDADALLESMSQATEEGNAYRVEQGFGAIHVTGWYEPPHYDEQSHNLVWAIEVVDDEGGKSINYNVRLLGRDGYTSVTLVVDPVEFEADKPEMARALGSFGYKSGKTYAEFRDGDKLAGYGLAALIAGGAAAKLGFFAALAKFLGKAWKLLVVAVLALAGAVKRAVASLWGGGPEKKTVQARG